MKTPDPPEDEPPPTKPKVDPLYGEPCEFSWVMEPLPGRTGPDLFSQLDLVEEKRRRRG